MATTCLHVSRTESCRVSVSHQESTSRYYQFLYQSFYSSLGLICVSAVPSLLDSCVSCHVSLSCSAFSLCLSHSFPTSSCSHTCVSKSTSAPRPQSKKDGLPPARPVYSLHSVLLPHQAVTRSLSLSFTCSLACSLSVSRPQQTVCTQTAADGGSAKLQGCLLCLSFSSCNRTADVE